MFFFGIQAINLDPQILIHGDISITEVNTASSYYFAEGLIRGPYFVLLGFFSFLSAKAFENYAFTLAPYLYSMSNLIDYFKVI